MEDSKYMCPVSDCLYSESENSKLQLATHVRKSHPTKSLYMCRHCSKCYCRLKRIQRHVEKKHSTDNHGETLFSVHVPYHLNVEKFQVLNGKFRVYCSFCDFITKDARKYNQHFQQVHEDCLSVCQSEADIDNQSVENVSGVDVACVENGMNSSVRVASCELKERLHVLKAHEVDRVVIEDDNMKRSPNVCEVDDRNEMQDSGDLLPKDKISSGFKHVNGKNNSGLVYGTTDLTTHIASSFKIRLKPMLGQDYHRCGVCGKSVKKLTRHMVIHGEPKHVCHLCPFKTVHSWTLKAHMLVHYRIEKFKCEICEKRFNESNAFTEHMSLHELDKFECEICKQRFRASRYLKAHIRSVHFPVGKFECDTCKKCFKDSRTLKSHMFVHSSVLNFECDICKKRFKSPAILKVHSGVHCVVKKFECHICKKRYTRDYHLRSHMLVHYREGLHHVGIR